MTSQRRRRLSAITQAALLLSLFETGGLSQDGSWPGWHYRSDARVGWIAVGPKSFVATGDDGVIYASTNAHTWVRVDSQTTNHLSGAPVYTGEQFVCVGNYGTIVTSPDGGTWTKRESGTPYWLASVAFGNGRMVAVGGGNYEGQPEMQVVVVSTNGVDWQVTSNQPGSLLYRVAFGAGRFVAITAFQNTMFWSIDGITWEANSLWAETAYPLNLEYVGNRFFAISYGFDADNIRSARVRTSQDGLTWSDPVFFPQDVGIADIGYGAGMYVAVGVIPGKFIPEWPPNPRGGPGGHWEPDTAALFTSRDGLEWHRESAPTPLLYSITYGQQTFVATGQGIYQSDVMVPRFARPVQLTPQGFQGEIVTEPGLSFRLQTATGFDSWTDLLQVINAPLRTPFLDPAATIGDPQRYYRVVPFNPP